MKILVIGLGSMGKRRIRNLLALNNKDIIGFDLRDDRRVEVEKDYGIQTFKNFEKALEQKPEIFIISVPPDKHIQYQLYAAKNNIPFFTEASVVDDGLYDLIEIVNKKNMVGVPSCTLRFHPAIKKIKELVENNEIGKICTFTHHSGQYLPDWHPWEKITEYYVSKKETGGCREIVPFELLWLLWIFRDLSYVYGNISQSLDFGAEIDDIYHIILTFKSGITGHLLVDVVSRFAYRDFRLLGEKGVIEWNWNEKDIRLYKAENNEWQILNIDVGETAANGYNPNIIEEMYIRELESFFNAVNNKAEYPYSLEEDLKILKILKKIEESNAKHTKIDVL